MAPEGKNIIIVYIQSNRYSWCLIRVKCANTNAGKMFFFFPSDTHSRHKRTRTNTGREGRERDRENDNKWIIQAQICR